QVTAYTQTADDIEAGIGNKPKAGQIAGNFNSLIMMRVKTPETAAYLTDLVPEVQVDLLMSVSGASDSDKPSEFSTANQDRLSSQDVPMLEPGDLTQLPKGQAFAMIEGGRLYKLRLPMPGANDDLPPGLAFMAEDMRSRYSSNEDWYHEEQWWQREAAA
ncbi:MAG: TraM recognition domain-containing protein, partial [Gammaproteobacteria bacterium]|nr:TraM recognition domain-containing protein [Gammaproteobacteria bacterium]